MSILFCCCFLCFSISLYNKRMILSNINNLSYLGLDFFMKIIKDEEQHLDVERFEIISAMGGFYLPWGIKWVQS